MLVAGSPSFQTRAAQKFLSIYYSVTFPVRAVPPVWDEHVGMPLECRNKLDCLRMRMAMFTPKQNPVMLRAED